MGITHRLKQATILDEEDVEIEGTKIPCYVVQAEYAQSKEEAEAPPSIKTYWIDKGRFVVLRESLQYHVDSRTFGPPADIKLTSSLTKVRLNEPVPDDLFVFTPPDGAKETEGNQMRLTAPISPH